MSATTLFVVASKTFGTLETLANARAARAWLLQCGCPEQQLERHFVAVSANLKGAVDFGIAPAHVLPMWDWVGGRYSLWSAIGLPIALSIGNEQFEALLLGAHRMDMHFRDAPLAANMPVLMALLSVWYRNAWGCASQAVIPYDQGLARLPEFLQQLVMESNGKSVDREGHALPRASSGKEVDLFAKFTRGKNESSTRGVGLGLAICKAVVDAHKGRISAHNADGGGAEFTITLPRRAPPLAPDEPIDTDQA